MKIKNLNERLKAVLNEIFEKGQAVYCISNHRYGKILDINDSKAKVSFICSDNGYEHAFTESVALDYLLEADSMLDEKISELETALETQKKIKKLLHT